MARRGSKASTLWRLCRCVCGDPPHRPPEPRGSVSCLGRVLDLIPIRPPPKLLDRLRDWALCVNPIYQQGLSHWSDRAAASLGRDEALRGLKRLLVVSAGHGSDVYRGGVLLLDLGRHSEALRWLARARATLSGRRDIRFSLAQAMFLARLL